MNNTIIWPTHRRKAKAQAVARVRKRPVKPPKNTPDKSAGQ